MLAWIITDKCIIRKPIFYFSIFILFFIEKMFWSIYYHFDYYENALDVYHIFIIFDFIIMVSVFILFWYLTKPKEFKNFNSFLKTKNIILVLFAAFFITMPSWLSRFIINLNGEELFDIIYSSTFSFNNYIFLTNAIPYIIGVLLFALLITNIKSNKKFGLYGLLIIFSILIYLPVDNFMFYGASEDFLKSFLYFFVFAISYFVIFFSYTLLSKTKYLD